MGVVYKSRKIRRGVSRKSYKGRSASRVIRTVPRYKLPTGRLISSYGRRISSAARGAIHAPRIPRTLGSLFPQGGKLIRHKYSDRVTLTAQTIAGNNQIYVFQPTSLWDPDSTGIGHQPMFRDDMADHYNNYTVMWCTIKVVIPAGEDSEQRVWGIVLSDSFTEITASTSFVSLLEQYSHTNTAHAASRTAPQVLTKTYNAAREFKTTYRGILADNEKSADKGANPVTASQRFFNIWCAPLKSDQTLDAITLQVEMVFSVMWRNNIRAGES